jgi:hypothetical protein
MYNEDRRGSAASVFVIRDQGGGLRSEAVLPMRKRAKRKNTGGEEAHPADAPAAAAAADEERDETAFNSPGKQNAAAPTPTSSRSSASKASPLVSAQLAISPDQLEKEAKKRGVHPLRREEGAAPLPREVPQEEANELAGADEDRRRERKTKKSGNTTESQYLSAWRKWWKGFCEYAGWDHEKMMIWLDPVTSECNADGIFIQFFRFMHATPGMTKSPFKNAIYWCEYELNTQRRLAGKREYDEYITSLPGVKGLKDEIYAESRTQKLTMMVDLTAEVEGEITQEQMCELMMHCYMNQTDEVNPLINMQVVTP